MEEQTKVSKKASQGIKLVNAILQLAKEKLTKYADIDDNGEVDLLNFDDLVLYVFDDDEMEEMVTNMLRDHYDDLSDQVTYEERVGWAEQRDIERTNRREFNLEMSRQINSIKQRNNN